MAVRTGMVQLVARVVDEILADMAGDILVDNLAAVVAVGNTAVVECVEWRILVLVRR